MVVYKYSNVDDNIKIETSLDASQFGDVMIAITAYSASVKDSPRLDIFGIGVGGSIMSEITKVDNAIYFGACDKNVYCVSDQGELLWKFQTNGINVSPTVSSGRVFIGSFDERFYYLDTNGKLLWKFDTNGAIASKPCTFGNSVCFGSKDSNVYCLSFKGELLWKMPTHGPITQDPVYYNGRIYIGSDDSALYVIDAKSGTLVRKIFSNGAFCTPVIVDDIIYVGCFDKNFYAFNLKGEKLWSFKHTTALGIRRPLFHNGIIYACSRDGYMYGIKTDGNLHRKYVTNENLWCTPVTDNKNIYFGSGDSNFYSFDIESGEVQWKFPTKAILASTASIEKDIIYFGGWDANLYAVTTKGELLWKFGLDMSTPSAIEPEEELQSAIRSQVVWRIDESTPEGEKIEEASIGRTDYGTMSSNYIGTGKSDYAMSGKKKGYLN